MDLLARAPVGPSTGIGLKATSPTAARQRCPGVDRFTTHNSICCFTPFVGLRGASLRCRGTWTRETSPGQQGWRIAH